MRKPLAEYKKEMSLRDTLRTLKGQIESILWMLRNMNTSAASTDATSIIWYTAASKAALPDAGDGVASTALGRVTAGTLQGACFVRHPTTDNWVSFTHLE